MNELILVGEHRLEDDLNRSSRYINENVDLHVYKNQLEHSYRDLKEENEGCEREKFELQEQMIDMENQLQLIRQERDQSVMKLLHTEQELQAETVGKTALCSANVNLRR